MSELRYTFPRDGIILSNAAGTVENGKLLIKPRVNALPNRELTVNGVPLVFADNYYAAKSPVALTPGVNTLTLCDTVSGERVEIEVRYFPNAHKKYRFSLDDNIWFLQNIAKKQDVYKSIFEDPYLTLLKTMHDRYGTKFHLNIYYECPEFGGFNLTDMPDKYKDEWKANSDWMRLSAHANANLPDRPYISATYEQTRFEFNRVNEQILRFAGEEAFADKVTTIHWGEATDGAVKAVRDLGVKAMPGCFQWGTHTNTDIAYNLTADQCALADRYGMYYDKNTDMIYFRYSEANIQGAPLDQIHKNFLDEEKRRPLYRFRELCVHEEYFYPHYPAYIPNYYERFDEAIRSCVEDGYEAAFVSEAFDI